MRPLSEQRVTELPCASLEDIVIETDTVFKDLVGHLSSSFSGPRWKGFRKVLKNAPETKDDFLDLYRDLKKSKPPLRNSSRKCK